MTRTLLTMLILTQLLASSSLSAQEPVEDDAFVSSIPVAYPLFARGGESMRTPQSTLREIQPFTGAPEIKLVIRRTPFSREHVLQLVEFGQGRFRVECVRHKRREEFFYVPPVAGLTSEQRGTHTMYGLRLSINLGSTSTGAEGD
jgi:hypothetical protein